MSLRFAEPAEDYYRMPLTIRHLLDNVLVVARDQQIVYRDLVTLSYVELLDRIGRLASALYEAGVREGDTVAVMDWDSHRYLEAYFAVPMMGAVLQTVNVRLPTPQVAYTLAHAKARTVLVHSDFFDLFEAVRGDVPGVECVLAMADGDLASVPAWVNGEYEAALAAADPGFPFRDFDEDAVATTFYTSGTTGDPKCVCFTHRQLVLQTLVAAGQFGATSRTSGLGYDDVYMPMTPLFHVHAWGTPYVATMLGVKQVYPGRYDAALICRLREQHRVTYSHCVPTLLRMVVDEAKKSSADLSGWKLGIGGSALSEALYLEATELGMVIYLGFGMTETAPTAIKGRPFLQARDAAEDLAYRMSCGVPTPMVSVQIVDEDMNPLPHDGETRGELVLRSPWITSCYVGDRAASNQLWRGGWMHTQDLATIDRRGYVRIRDRIKDVIKTGGEWIDSIQLEFLVGAAKGVREASVVAVADARWGERPLAVVVVEPGAEPTLDDLNAPVIAAIEQGLITRYARLDRFACVTELPRTTVGKIDKKRLREIFG